MVRVTSIPFGERRVSGYSGFLLTTRTPHDVGRKICLTKGGRGGGTSIVRSHKSPSKTEKKERPFISHVPRQSREQVCGKVKEAAAAWLKNFYFFSEEIGLYVGEE